MALPNRGFPIDFDCRPYNLLRNWLPLTTVAIDIAVPYVLFESFICKSVKV